MLYTIKIYGHDRYAANGTEIQAELPDNDAATAFIEPIRKAYPMACVNWSCRQTGDFACTMSWNDLQASKSN